MLSLFHPTVFDNIRVVLEGAVYDRDLDGEILVTSRSDIMDLATFGRHFQIAFIDAKDTGVEGAVTVRMDLRTSLADIASEQLEHSLTEHVGCFICISFSLAIRDVERDTSTVLHILNGIWGNRPHITQQVSFVMGEHRAGANNWPPEVYRNKVVLDFHRKIDEGNIEDLNGLVEHCVKSLVELRQRFR